MKTQEQLVREQNSVLVAGELMGVALRLDADALERYLASLDEGHDFRYIKQCRAAIKFKRTIFNENSDKKRS